MKDFQEAVGFYQRLRLLGTHPGLNSIRQLLRLLGNPQNTLRFVHVAGTNGKGSTCAFLASMLTRAGYRVGLYTSPHLTKYTDVIRIDGAEIDDADFVRYTAVVQKLMQQVHDGQPTEFEVLTALAFRYFADRQVDLVVLETGLGGRSDATNIISENLLSVFTHIAIDHTEYLGDSVALIAEEKAGIIKPGGIVVTAPQEAAAHDVIARVAAEMGCPLIVSRTEDAEIVSSDLDELVVQIRGDESAAPDGASRAAEPELIRSGLVGDHQRENLMLARTAAHALRDRCGLAISDEAIRAGIEQVSWQGRLQKLSDAPLVYADGAHNLDGVQTLFRTLRHAVPDRPIIGVYGTLRRDNIDEILRTVLDHVDGIILTEPHDRRAMSLDDLQQLVIVGHDYMPLFASTDYEQLIRYIEARSKKADASPVYVAFGSLYFIRDFIPLFGA